MDGDEARGAGLSPTVKDRVCHGLGRMLHLASYREPLTSFLKESDIGFIFHTDHACSEDVIMSRILFQFQRMCCLLQSELIQPPLPEIHVAQVKNCPRNGGRERIQKFF